MATTVFPILTISGGAVEPIVQTFTNQSSVTITHTLGRLPFVQVFVLDGDEYIRCDTCDVTTTSTQIYIEFDVGVQSGKVQYF